MATFSLYRCYLQGYTFKSLKLLPASCKTVGLQPPTIAFVGPKEGDLAKRSGEMTWRRLNEQAVGSIHVPRIHLSFFFSLKIILLPVTLG